MREKYKRPGHIGYVLLYFSGSVVESRHKATNDLLLKVTGKEVGDVAEIISRNLCPVCKKWLNYGLITEFKPEAKLDRDKNLIVRHKSNNECKVETIIREVRVKYAYYERDIFSGVFHTNTEKLQIWQPPEGDPKAYIFGGKI